VIVQLQYDAMFIYIHSKAVMNCLLILPHCVKHDISHETGSTYVLHRR